MVAPRATRQRRWVVGGLEPSRNALRGRTIGGSAVIEEFLDKQQHAADLLATNGLLPKTIQVRSAMLPWIGEVVQETNPAATVRSSRMLCGAT
ncbi:hypothetical protein [Nocardia australiensis]|uniref:hypothetical protein n=1 Tax=Nocardia australiensis TaxID=2887191 RepID=UPI003558E580